MNFTYANVTSSNFEIRFESLFSGGRGFAFPCDAAGHVDIDALSERCRNNYFFARAMLGRDYATPRVIPCGRSTAHSSPLGGSLVG
jgi:hypothetical protein